MTISRNQKLLLCLATFSVFGAQSATAQWNANTTVNLPVAVTTGTQARTKVASDALDGTWIGWFDNSSGAYELRLQRLDAQGVATLPANGLLVSSHPQAATPPDWDLLVDRIGRCVIVFTDTRAGGDADVSAYCIDAIGTFVWGANGVQLSNNGDEESAPRIVELPSLPQSYIVVWSRAPSVGDGTVRVQKLNGAGAAQFAPDGDSLPTTAGESAGLCSVVASPQYSILDDGAYIISWVQDLAAARRIRGVKFTAAGLNSTVWLTPTTVFDQTPIPVGHEPQFISDGLGGAWWAWVCDVAGVQEVRVQQLAENGLPSAIPVNGMPVSLESGRVKREPRLSLAADIYPDAVISFVKSDTAQTMWALSAQRIFSNTTVRNWTNDGIALTSFDTTRKFNAALVSTSNATLAAWLEKPGGSPPAQIRAQRVSPAGSAIWAAGGAVVSDAVSDKLEVEATDLCSGGLVCAWQDTRVDSGDLFAQNLDHVGGGGSVVPQPPTPFCFGDGSLLDHMTPCPCGNNGAAGSGCANSFVASGASLTVDSGGVMSDDLVLRADGMIPVGLSLFIQHCAPDDRSFYDGVLCAGGMLTRLRGRQHGPSQGLPPGSAIFPHAGFANDATLTLSQRGGVYPGQGVRRYYSAWYRNASSTFCPPATANVSSGLQVDW